MTASMALHGGALAAYLFLSQMAPKTTYHSVTGVDIIRVARPIPQAAGAPKPPPIKVMDLLKMALPTAPKLAAPMALNVPLPVHKDLMPEPKKLEDASRRTAGPAIKPLDLSAHSSNSSLAPLDMPDVETHHTKALAALPVLEEVGRSRPKNLAAAIKLDDERKEAVQQMTLDKLSVPTHVRVAPTQAMQVLQDAAPDKQPSIANKIANLLPQDRGVDQPQEMRAVPDDIAKKLAKDIAPPPRHTGPAALGDAPKKAVEITGALKDRPVTASEVPPYPEKLKSLGIPEIPVRLNFCVSQAGDVQGDSIATDLSSGYGWLDKLCAASLLNWKFAPVGAEENQCGSITFNFELE
jgi:hypothetical protein